MALGAAVSGAGTDDLDLCVVGPASARDEGLERPSTEVGPRSEGLDICCGELLKAAGVFSEVGDKYSTSL